MDQTFTFILLLLSSSVSFGKYVFIRERKTWHEAQKYCRTYHTDLAPVSNAHDTQRLRQIIDDSDEYIWIGFERNSTDPEKWTWSGGGAVSTFFWAANQPNNRAYEDYGIMRHYLWHDATAGYFDPFLCYSVVVVRERKTWEEALNYCREHHRDLASVASDTEMLLIQRELSKNDTTAHVWIGLHFFPGEWLWVDGQPLSYEAWGQEGKPACPEVKLECAALQVMGVTQSNNGTDSTPFNSTVGPNLAHTHTAGSCGVDSAAHDSPENPAVGNTSVGVKESVWEACDCEERLHFICY